MYTTNFFPMLLVWLSCFVKHGSSIGSIVEPSPGNPCVFVCDDEAHLGDPSSQACATCCRTVEHEIPWNCDLLDEGETPGQEDEEKLLISPAVAAPWVTYPSFLGEAGDAVAASCVGDWQPEWWNIPSAENLGHACSMCCGPCTNAFNGCGNCAETTGGCVCGGCDANGKCQARESFANKMGPGGMAIIIYGIPAIFLCILICCCCECEVRRRRRGRERQQNQPQLQIPPRNHVSIKN